MDANKLAADGLNEQCRYHRRVHAAAESKQNFFIAHLLADERHLFLDKRVGKFPRGDANHRFGTFILIHVNHPLKTV